MRSFQYFLIMLFCATLIGCSKEPSDDEVTKVIANVIKEDAANLIEKKLLGLNLGSVLGIEQLKINTIEKIGFFFKKKR